MLEDFLYFTGGTEKEIEFTTEIPLKTIKINFPELKRISD